MVSAISRICSYAPDRAREEVNPARKHSPVSTVSVSQRERESCSPSRAVTTSSEHSRVLGLGGSPLEEDPLSTSFWGRLSPEIQQNLPQLGFTRTVGANEQRRHLVHRSAISCVDNERTTASSQLDNSLDNYLDNSLDKRHHRHRSVADQQ
uniref:Uncharacterized protein n=1 Tax=Timema cristinae TaxID=61476 RepID=A0A7R9D0T7_TIMCR|nr:unnamed protein product [Timema cristinae]